MSSLWIGIIGGVVRLLLMPVINWAVSKGIVEASQTVDIIANVTAFAIGVVWVVWNKFNERRLLNTAVAVAPGSSVADVKAIIASGKSASALAPDDETPIVFNNTGDGQPVNMAKLGRGQSL